MHSGHQPVEGAQLRALLAEGNWELAAGRLRRQFTFVDFGQAMAFMTAVAFAAEKLNHHPDWRNVYNKVEITLWTHETGDISEHDLKLAEVIDKLAKQFGVK